MTFLKRFNYLDWYHNITLIFKKILHQLTILSGLDIVYTLMALRHTVSVPNVNKVKLSPIIRKMSIGRKWLMPMITGSFSGLLVLCSSRHGLVIR